MPYFPHAEALRALALFKELLVHAEQSENIDLSISELLEDTVDTLGSPLFSELIDIQNRTHKVSTFMSLFTFTMTSKL